MENPDQNINPTPPAPPVVQVPPVSNPINPPTRQKSKFPLGVIIGIILFLLIAGSAAGFYVLKQQSSKIAVKPTPSQTITPSPTTDPTANWKTYTNTQLEFSLKYPDNWEYKDNGNNSSGGNQIIFGDPSRKVSNGNGTTTLAGDIELKVYDKNILGNYIPYGAQIKMVKINNLTIQEAHSKSCPSSNDCITIIFEAGNNTFVLTPWVDSDKYKDLDIIYKMISTFKLTDQTSDLSKIYTGKGFSFQIPIEYSILTILDNKVEFIITDHGMGLTTLRSQNIPFQEPIPQPNSELNNGTGVVKTSIKLDGKQVLKYTVTKTQTENSTNEVVYFSVGSTYYELNTQVDAGGVSVDKFVSTFKFTNQVPTPTATIGQTVASPGGMCGGIAGIICPSGYSCKYAGNYPDASGTCVKN